MWDWILKALRIRRARKQTHEQRDVFMEAVLSECWRTGKTVIGSLDDDGSFEMTVCDDEYDIKTE